MLAVLVLVGMGWLARPAPEPPPELVVSESPEPTLSATATPEPEDTRPPVATGRWTVLSPVEAPARTRQTMLWTGSDVLVFGGQPDPGPDTGLVLDPDADTWRRMAESPIGSRSGHTAVWTGREMIVFEGAPVGQFAAVVSQDVDGAAYDPATDTWREIARAPVNPRSGHVALWTGEEMLVFGGSRTFETNVQAGAYDPDTDTWRLTAPAPLPRGFGLIAGVWTGEEAVFWTGRGPEDVAAYDPATDTWRLLPPSPVGMRSVAATWTGREMILLGVPEAGSEDIGGMALDMEEERWTVLPPSPQAFAATRVAEWTGEQVVMLGGPQDQPGVAWTPARATWEMLPPAPQPATSGHSAVWIGDSLLLWGGFTAEWPTATGAVWTPTPG
ncbi:hypothetical protein DVS28_a4863 [Euzebya pacifica]|uniref:Galactose oxidase n=1 Tax=Euzebya pacifica TaxID=1608957 RepID=A0A346Y4X3_9ACTN|nr:hypothetical protein DVS28_a4863 [Euzebya pacifica]